MEKKSFTLIELLVTIGIIGILAALALPSFGVAKERVMDKEARDNLVFIQSGEKIYRMEAGVYYPSSGSASGIDDINSNLKINLPSAMASSWSYKVDTDATAITATRLPVETGRIWTLTYTGDTSCCTGTGCPIDAVCPP